MQHAMTPHVQAIALVTAKEVASLLRVSLRTVWRMRDAGHLPDEIRMGRSIRWRKDQLADWMAKGCPKRSPAKES